MATTNRKIFGILTNCFRLSAVGNISNLTSNCNFECKDNSDKKNKIDEWQIINNPFRLTIPNLVSLMEDQQGLIFFISSTPFSLSY